MASSSPLIFQELHEYFTLIVRAEVHSHLEELTAFSKQVKPRQTEPEAPGHPSAADCPDAEEALLSNYTDCMLSIKVIEKWEYADSQPYYY